MPRRDYWNHLIRRARGDHMLNVESRSLKRLVHLAILTPAASTRRNEITRSICHELCTLRFAAKEMQSFSTDERQMFTQLGQRR